MENISPRQVADWYFAKAKEYEALGRQIEDDFNLTNGEPRNPFTPRKTINIIYRVKPINPDEIRALLAKRKMRSQDLADAIGVSRGRIEEAVNAPDSGFSRNKRGWIQISPPKPPPI